ncbi:hypothetical protein [Nocardioides sp.]|uniref:hypothetical protein n=1 Tax=Nocardioides sp. TaxID=35761 RepID=UPI002BCD3D64|nr:hypothetical protein [Nocardioides sp.]HXH80133.1 hypothetical protein [Nocardioides sp.]
MSVDEDFETVLRQQFRLHEPRVSPAAGLTHRIMAEGRRERRKRRARYAVSAGVGAVALGAAVSMSGLRPSEPDTAKEPAVPATSGTARPAEKQALAEWAAGLPRGAAPEVAYLAGTTVHLPGGAVRDLDVADAAIVGQTVAGLIIFVEENDPQGVLAGTRFVLVQDDGTTTDMQASTAVEGAAYEAVVSPDGRYFTNGDQVIDKSTGATVGEMPEAAEVLVSWTSEGIIYSARGQEYFLWRLGEAPIALDGFPGVFDVGSDVGLRGAQNGCAEAVRIAGSGEVTTLSAGCVPDLLSVSPDGTTGVTTDLRVIDLATADASSLSDTPLHSVRRDSEIHWLDDDDLLLSVPAGNGSSRLVRCSTAALRCESATGPVQVGVNESVRLP